VGAMPSWMAGAMTGVPCDGCMPTSYSSSGAAVWAGGPSVVGTVLVWAEPTSWACVREVQQTCSSGRAGRQGWSTCTGGTAKWVRCCPAERSRERGRGEGQGRGAGERGSGDGQGRGADERGAEERGTREIGAGERGAEERKAGEKGRGEKSRGEKGRGERGRGARSRGEKGKGERGRGERGRGEGQRAFRGEHVLRQLASSVPPEWKDHRLAVIHFQSGCPPEFLKNLAAATSCCSFPCSSREVSSAYPRFSYFLVAESASVCPPSVGGECALSTDVLEDRQEEFQCFAAALPHLVSTLLAPEGDPDAPDIPTPRSYAEAIEGPYSSQWQAAMDAEMASWKSTGIYVDEVPPPGANIVSGMWIFRVKRPPGSPPAFKARYVARGFSQRQGVEYFQTFSPTPKMTTLWVLLHVAAQRNYELHSLDFSTAFLQGSLHKEIWLRRPPGFTGSFPPGTQWSLRRPVYGLRQAPREWHDTLRTTLAALGFAPSTADPSLFLRTDTSLPPFYVLVYVDDLVFATADTAGLAHVKSELQKRHTCTDLGELRSFLGLQITRDRAQRTITLTQSHMVQQVLQRFDFTYSSPQATPLSTVQTRAHREDVEPEVHPIRVSVFPSSALLMTPFFFSCFVLNLQMSGPLATSGDDSSATTTKYQ
ncbi:unnamed protein product, partial [Closterium sp. NIES-54]